MKRILKIALWTIVGLLFIGSFVYLYINSRPKEERYNLVNASTPP